MDDSRIRTAAELISALISPKTAEEAGAWAKVVGVWPRLVGERAAAHSRITDISNHFVLVDADHPGWIQLLHFRQSELLKEMQRGFPAMDIRGIQFRLSRKGQPDGTEAASEARETVSGPSAEEREPEPYKPLRLDPETIQDEALKSALLGLRDAMEGR